MSFRLFRKYPFFIFLLPLFFVLHGFAQYVYFIPVSSVGMLALWYLFFTLLLTGVFLLIYRHLFKAGFAVFATLFLFLFFGAFHDFLNRFFANTFLVKYTFLLPFMCMVYISLLIVIKKKAGPDRLVIYLNTVLLVLILIDAGTLFFKTGAKKEEASLQSFCSTCAKPDVHFIVVDGFAGKKQMEQEFPLTNALFFDSLQKLGFRVLENSQSNYVRTEFSMASMLNMEYHQLKDYRVTDESLFYCYRQIAKNKVVDAFQQQGYQVVNNSIFDLESKRSPVRNTFLVTGTDLIQSETLLARLRRDVYIPLLMKYLRNTRLYWNFIFQALESDKKLVLRLQNLAREKSEKPRFIYSHLLMTHFPYYFQENGQLNKKEDIRADNYGDKELYRANLQFTGNRLLSLMNTILRSSPTPPVIILLSDHGFRYSGRPENAFSTLGAVYLPNKDYRYYYDSLSAVNQFRVLFNTLFRQQLPLLQDRNGEVPDKDQRE